MKSLRSLTPLVVIILLLIILAGMVWTFVHSTGLSISGDGFLVQWIGIHALADGGTSPYSDPVSAQIAQQVHTQTAFAPGIAPKYTSPLYSGLLVLPFALVGDKNISHALWMAAQLIALFAIILISLRVTGWKPAWYVFLLFALFTSFSYHALVPWLDGGLSLWAALFMVSSFLAISQKRYELGGILLGLSFIQPQMVILPVIFTMIWVASQRKAVLILWFFITLVFLSVVGLLLVPDWIIRYFRLLFNFGQNFPAGNPAALFKNNWPGLGIQLGWLLTVIVSLILLVEWWLARRREFRWFLWTVCLTIVLSQWIGIPSIPANLSALVLPFVLVSAMLAERWPHGGDWVAVGLCILVFAWEWALYYLDISGSAPAIQLNLLLPLPLVALLGLYWVRWWAIKPRRLLVEELKLVEPY